MANHPDLFIIGGGIIGLTAAIRFREAGLSVAICDRGEFGREASWAGAGIIPPGNPENAGTAIDRLRAIGSVQLPGFSQQLRFLTNIENGYRRNGAIEFLEEDEAEVVKVWASEGIRFHLVNSTQTELGLATATDAAYLLPDMAQVRNPWHLRALISACHKIGVELLPNTGVESWIHSDNRVGGIQLSSGDVRTAGQYLVAAGPWSKQLLAPLGTRVGVAPIRGQILLLKTAVNALQHTLIWGKRYLVPRGDGLILVGSTEEPEAGFVKDVTEDGLNELRLFANHLLPTLHDAEVVNSWAGLRPGSPDGLPLIGRVPGHTNVLAAIGHYRAGVQLSLGTAQLLVELATQRETCVPIAAFALNRVPDVRVKPAFRS
jgi:glycine oxidase